MSYVFGRFVGYLFFWSIVKPMRFIYGRRDCEYHNTEILREMAGKPCIVVSNHIKPRNRFLRWISMPYDAYLLRKMLIVHGIKVTALTSYDSYASARGRAAKWIQTRIKAPLVKGIVKSMDLVPLNRKESDKDTIREMRRRVDKKHWIGIFPEGTWFRGFRAGRKLHAGMAVLGKRYNLPILPIYLHAYNMKTPVQIRIGELIQPEHPGHVVAEMVRQQILALRIATGMPAHNPA